MVTYDSEQCATNPQAVASCHTKQTQLHGVGHHLPLKSLPKSDESRPSEQDVEEMAGRAEEGAWGGVSGLV